MEGQQSVHDVGASKDPAATVESNASGGVSSSSSDSAGQSPLASSSQAQQPVQSKKVSSSKGKTGKMAKLTGTGKEMAGGPEDASQSMLYEIERPFTNFGRKESVYTKSHKFMTFGFAPVVLAKSAGESWLTTYLAELPWHLPIFYMNRCEFSLCPPGSRVKLLNVKVVYRGATIQFGTAASKSNIATLNQINDIGCAIALNKTGWGSNISYSGFDSDKTMIPTSITKPRYKPISGTYRGLEHEYYGTNNDDSNFASYMPKHQLGRHAFLYNYFAMSTRTANLTPGTASNLYGGWPCLAEKIDQMDGKTAVNQQVLECTYEPRVGPLKKPLRNFGIGLPQPNAGESMNIPTMGNLVQARSATLTKNGADSGTIQAMLGGDELTATENKVEISNKDLTDWNLYSPIEKSQIMKSGFWGQSDAHVQPSIHIGVQPVPSLSTAFLNMDDKVYNDWTETRAYWEVVATAVVIEHQPTAFPYAANANVPAGEVMLEIPEDSRPSVFSDPADETALYAGLYKC